MSEYSTPPSPGSPARVLLRIAALLSFIVAATWCAHIVRDALNLQVMPANEQQVHNMIMIGAIAYVALLAVPFVPGVEIGLAMLTAFGAAIAPLVYVATVLALSLSYTRGRMLPMTALARVLAILKVRRAADLVRRAASLSRDERLTMLLEDVPPGIMALALRRRYVALALVLNIPGNALIGGGGGIALLAGMSGLFAPLLTFLAFAIAVSPVPLAVVILSA
ncbi:hypothetical protein QO034_22800 [Sedimentitalea sp. JM2-8]|uniref:TVP38/TMEM64 family membrane protein n=1 Tax=Sedimentitalea xiamensis TaxID=3050037 RepID=A0ABT7FL51_9RHOB|nr:hypothetical protein [Sedimentitalea xiamensis]MDK3075887.1 hypothetical protein [Sedimentitalea xiamensis]